MALKAEDLTRVDWQPAARACARTAPLRNRETEGLGGLEVDHQFELRRGRQHAPPPGLLDVTCLVLGAAVCSCFGLTIALVMAGFAGPPERGTTIGPATLVGGSGWLALHRSADAFLRLFGWSAAFGLGTLAILAWLGVIAGVWRLAFRRSAPPSATPSG